MSLFCRQGISGFLSRRDVTGSFLSADQKRSLYKHGLLKIQSHEHGITMKLNKVNDIPEWIINYLVHAVPEVRNCHRKSETRITN